MLTFIRQKPESTIDWIDITDPTAEELDELAAKYRLHPASVQDCLQPEHLPKFEEIENTFFVICRYFDEEAPKDADTIQQMSRKISIFFRDDMLITVHRKPYPPFDALLKKCMTLDLSVFEIVCKIVKVTLSSYEAPLEKLDREIDFYESRIFLRKKTPDLIKNLYSIKRKTYVMRKLYNIKQEIIDNLAVPSAKSGPVYQDLRDYYVRVDTMIEAVYDDIANLLNVYISLSSQRTNEVMRTLTVFTAFFLPLTFIVGVYGMNFSYMPELNHHYGYPAVLGIMAVITLIIYVWFRRKGWL